MARAYIVLARNDLDEDLLQVLDLAPNSSQFSPAYDGQGTGQTGYLTHYLIDGVNVPVTLDIPGAGGGATRDFSAAVPFHYGLSTYLMDCVGRPQAPGSPGPALTVAEATNVAGDIEAAVAAGTPLTLAVINAILVARVVAATDLDGAGANSHSVGSVEDILRILAGERYRVAGGAEVQGGGGRWNPGPRGYFVDRPNVLTPDTVVSTQTGTRSIRGRKHTAPLSHLRPGEPRAGNVPVQGAAQDTNFNDVRTIVETGHLHLSATDGVLADLKAATYAFENPAFTYGAAGTALTLGGANILAGGVARAITVYDADGNVI